MTRSPGMLALVGGGEWSEGCEFDAELLAASGSNRVVLLPTAGAFERPERMVLQAAQWFAVRGAEVEGLMVTTRADAMDSGAAAAVGAARFLYLAGGSPMHLRSVLKRSAVWEALVSAWRDGAVVAASSGAALAITDPMVDARGGGLTVGLGLIDGLAVIPHFGDRHQDEHGTKLHRAVALAPPDIPVVGIPEHAALIRLPTGNWESRGADGVSVYLDGSLDERGTAALSS